MHVEWLHERKARIRKTVAVTFLIWPAFSYSFRFYGLATKGSSIIVLRMLMSTKWRGRRYINQASSSEKKIRLVFILLYWYAENSLGVDLIVNEETEASYGPTLRVVHVRCHAQCLASRGNVIPTYGKTYSTTKSVVNNNSIQ